MKREVTEMAENKYFSDEARRMELEELESVAGGRRVLRETEKRDWIRVRETLEEKARRLKQAGYTREAGALEMQYHEAYDLWIDHIKMAPEDGPDLLFSDYFEC